MGYGKGMRRATGPGTILQRELEERDWSVETLAERANLALDVVEKVLANERAITKPIARALGKALGTSADLWYQMSRNYRAWLRDAPVVAQGFMTDDLQAALDKIEKPHVAKKRNTVLLLAFATASDRAWSEVFDDDRACNQRIWYQKWQHDPAIADALALAERRALAWRDGETARIESSARQRLRRALAEGSLDGVRGMRETALANRDKDGIDAAMKLIAMFDEETALRAIGLDGGAAVPVEVENLDEVIAQLLASEGEGGEDAAAP